MNRLILLSLFVALPSMALDIHKCKGQDGRVDYSNSPCTATQQSLKIDGLPRQKQPEQPLEPQAVFDPERIVRTEPTRSIAPPKPPVPNPVSAAPASAIRLATVITQLESLDGDGKDCRWALESSGRSMQACARFLPQMRGNGAWTQAVSELQSLVQDRSFAEKQGAQLEQATRLAERVTDHSQFVSSRLFSGR